MHSVMHSFTCRFNVVQCERMALRVLAERYEIQLPLVTISEQAIHFRELKQF